MEISKTIKSSLETIIFMQQNFKVHTCMCSLNQDKDIPISINSNATIFYRTHVPSLIQYIRVISILFLQE